jgi:hypothetical protein
VIFLLYVLWDGLLIWENRNLGAQGGAADAAARADEQLKGYWRSFL